MMMNDPSITLNYASYDRKKANLEDEICFPKAAYFVIKL